MMNVFEDQFVIHPTYMAQLSDTKMVERCAHAGNLGTFSHLAFYYSITPSDPEYVSETLHVKNIVFSLVRNT